MKIYIAGPMRGYPNFNFPAFDAAEVHLIRLGHEVVNPANLDRQIGIDGTETSLPEDFLRGAMKRDLIAICNCDAIYLLKNWHKSRGVAVELELAKLLDLEIITEA